MADRPRFGPAGIPPLFEAMGAALADVPRLLREEGLDAFEYEAVRWGKKPQIDKKAAEKLGTEAERNDVWLSLHGSYFMNFCGSREIVSASKQRLIASATAAKWMKARIVVFHLGYYGNKLPSLALKNCVNGLKETVETLKTLEIRDVRLGLETMGKAATFGTLDEIIAICKEVDQTQLVIDWSHLHARSGGKLRTVDDFRNVIEKVEKQLGTEAAKNLHCHFTKVEFGEKGEKRHHILDEERYGPDFGLLAKVIAEFKLNPVVISETPLLDIDAVKMHDILQKELKS
jgi:deoxyribonuclease-4